MNSAKRKRLKSIGFKVGSVREFLDWHLKKVRLSNLKLRWEGNYKLTEKPRRLTQIEFARKIKSSQSRVAKMESGDPSVSIDLIVRSFFALGASQNSLPKLSPKFLLLI
jgi:hypothetical protein